MTPTRPKYATGHDSNHHIIRDFMRDVCGGFEDTKIGKHPAYQAWFRGVKFTAIDTSRIGGFLLDWLLICRNQVVFVEVKTPEARKAYRFQDGERWMLDECLPVVRVVEDDRQVADLFAVMVE